MNARPTQGAIAALLGEYERSISDLKTVLNRVSDAQLLAIADADTPDPDCRSIQSVIAHVVHSGYGYAVYIHNHRYNDSVARPRKVNRGSASQYCTDLNAMFEYNISVLSGLTDKEMEAYAASKKLKTNWGQLYDYEQIIEHGIVHILRHRRQIERFLAALA